MTAATPEFQLGVHAQITMDANAALSPGLDEGQLQRVVLSNMWVDHDQFNSCLHFDNCAFDCGVQRIASQWTLIDAQSNRLDDAALGAFGRLLHTTQDFYAHSNWVELNVQQDPIPVWDMEVSSLPAGIVSGTFLLDFPKLCGPGAPTHSELNKDGPNTSEGKKIVAAGPNQGRSLFDLAKATAVAASIVQFQRLLAGISADDRTSSRSALVAPEALQQMAGFLHATSDRVGLEKSHARSAGSV